MTSRERTDSLEHTLARLSADEIVSALGLSSAPAPVRVMVRGAFSAVSRPLGRILSRFDARIDAIGLAYAAAAALADLGASWKREGDTPPARGPLLVVANHPGAYDTLTLLAALGRDDVAMVASDRAFLRALPALAARMLFAPEGPSASVPARARALRQALRHLLGGGALLHFGAGRIESDPAFAAPAEVPVLAPWQRGTGALVRHAALANVPVAVAIAFGVHSPKAKRLWVTRMAERRGLYTLAPLLQMSIPHYRRVDATARFALLPQAVGLTQGGDDEVIAARVRERACSLLPPPPLPRS